MVPNSHLGPRRRVAAAGLALVVSSGFTPVSGHEAGRRAAQPEATAVTLQVDYGRSYIVVVLHRSGLLGFLGHEHGILVRQWSAAIEYDPAAPADTRVEVTISVPALVIDSPDARARAGVDPDGPSPEEARQIQADMLSPSILAAQQHPEITFRTVAARAHGERLVLGGPLTIRGMSRTRNVTVTVQPEGDSFRVTGELELRLTEFGIEPPSVAGVVRVANEVDVRFEIVARQSG